MDIREVILAPIITEKSTRDVANGKFTFRVNIKADKKLIKKAIEDRFKVNVTDVATIIVKGRSARFGVRRTEVLRKEWKKAVVTLKKDQKIDLFETGGVK